MASYNGAQLFFTGHFMARRTLLVKIPYLLCAVEIKSHCIGEKNFNRWFSDSDFIGLGLRYRSWRQKKVFFTTDYDAAQLFFFVNFSKNSFFSIPFITRAS